ncbi:PmoA family protein [Nocardiopsis tropica]|uniref:PmoA family protein n=1 Tax=Nocardiopsis tropica TaxID=109330 RepID=A0ABU7KYS1_9ACTN|nr:PmoA family protein [Nocardiopsis umidischolae]MEE2054414.1 PmoA family protein [Nocardiopsis umidischolae]
MPDTITLSRGPDALTVTAAGTEIARYVLRPDAPAVEAPKPFLHPLRTLGGAPLTAVRPWDHRWHKGLQMTWSHVSGQNFWGGPTFVRGSGYQWLDNVGTIRHERFEAVVEGDGEAAFTESLSWTASTGERWIGERRTHRFHAADPARGIWALDFATSLTNVRGSALELGSPTTHGRDAAGYTGLFWRGPRSWTGCDVVSATGVTGGDVMGTRSDWIALTGQHDEIDGGATVLCFAGTSSGAAPIRWFVRSEPFPVFSPSPSFDETVVLEPGGVLDLRHRLVFVDRMCASDEVGALAAEFAP